MGFNGVSFYTDWGLQEGARGTVVNDGIWSLDEFSKAASEAGIYLIARPGPYINAEVAAGGFPGWALKLNSTLRYDYGLPSMRTAMFGGRSMASRNSRPTSSKSLQRSLLLTQAMQRTLRPT